LFVFAVLCSSCSDKKAHKIITIENTLDMERKFETVEISFSELKLEDIPNIGIRDMDSGDLQVIQKVDNEGDGVIDVILFQPLVAAKSEKKYEIVVVSEDEKSETMDYCFSRFVPERTDDYAWENDKVAFRVFGPKAQRLVEEGKPGGTLSSGVDAWLKKVNYPIINKWYKENEEEVGSYHIDHGEGLDNFHVGISRGIGGIAVKEDTTYYYSKNFTKWRTITTGPLRTSFYIEFSDWKVGNKSIKESRVISLDYGSNLSKFVISLEGTDKVSVGLTLHEKDGIVSGNNENNWVGYWQPHGDSELGTAILSSDEYFVSYDTYDTNAVDESNVYAHLNVVNNEVTYYAGFTWKESGQFKDKEEWEQYLNQFSKKIIAPLKVSVK
jgi:hypothetical protein